MSLESLKEFATDRQCEIIDAIIEHGSQAKAATALNTNLRGMQRAVKRAKENASRRGWSPEHDMNHSVPDTHVVKGVSTFYDENGTPIRQWVKSDLKKQSEQEALEAFVTALRDDLPKYQPLPSNPLKSMPQELTAYVIGDAHIGMKASTDRNRGEGDWNLEIAERVTKGAIYKLIKAAGPTDTGLLLDLGDMQHADNMQSTTTSGTQLDVDGDFGDTIAACVRIYRESIEMMLDNHNHVYVMCVRGNHNSSTSRIMNVMLQSFYSECNRVTIMDNCHKYQSLVYGNNLLVTHHGDRLKAERGQEYIARSMYKEWGLCEHRHMLCGHIHHAVSKEVGGLMVEWFQALPAPDAWHSDSGYGAKRSMSAIVYDKEHGEISRFKVNINQLGGDNE